MKLYLAGTEMEGKESEVMEFWFEHDSGFDHEVLAIIDLLRAAGHPVGLATNQEKYRMAHLLAHPALRDRIDAAYPSWEAGYKKPDTRYFQAVNRAVYDRFGARRIIFVDDLAANVETARELDWEAHCFLQDEPDAIAKLESFLAPYLAAETRE